MAIKSRQRKAKELLDADNKLNDLRWWKQDGPHRAVFANVERLGVYARLRQAQDLHYACLYDDAELAQMIQGADAIEAGIPQTMTTNVIRREVNSFVAQIVVNKPLPMAMTNGGNYAEQRRAKALTRFFGGILDEVGYYETRRLRIRDAAIFGSGLARNFRVGRKLYHQRLFPWEVRFDPLDAMKGRPRTLFFRHQLDRLVAMDRWPKFAEQIKRSISRTADDLHDVTFEKTADTVLIEEAFHLPNGDVDIDQAGKKGFDPKDGAWAMCCSEATLAQGDYLRDYHQLSKLDFSPGVFGWWGEGLVRQLSGLQFEINSIGLRLQEQGFLTGSYVLVPAGSGIETEVFDNGALTVIRYEGQKPEWVTPPPWHPAFFDYFMALRGQFVSDVSGLPGMVSRGEGPPPGVTSGKAQRTFHEIAQLNLVPFGHADEEDCVNTAWQLFDLLEEIHDEAGEDGEKFVVKVERRSDGRSVVDDIDFAKVRMDRASFKLRSWPTNFLASTPTDRWQQIADMAQQGLFSEDELVSLLDFPDLQRVLNLRGAPRRVVEKIIEKFLDAEGEMPRIKPEPTMNLDICVALGTLAYLEAKWIDDVPEENTSALLDFVVIARLMRDGKLDENGNPIQAQDQGQNPAQANGGVGPQPGDQSPDATMPEAMPALGGGEPSQLFAPPTGAPLPGNAVAPQVMPPPGAEG